MESQTQHIGMESQIHYVNTNLILVRADHKDGSLGSVTSNRAQPELKPGMLMAQADVPQQKVHSAIGQEKLHMFNIIMISIYYDIKCRFGQVK